MKQPHLLVFLVLGFMVLSPCLNAAGESLHSDDNQGMNNIVRGLPWTFSCSIEKGGEGQFPGVENIVRPVDQTRYQFRSRSPIKEDSGGGTYLNITLRVGTYREREEAQAVFQAIGRHAHPDTGLTYQWDLVALHGVKIYYLHADCLLSREHFYVLSEELIQQIGVAGGPDVQLMTCRCGGGCRH